jgi:CheY-like chemotaxis protein
MMRSILLITAVSGAAECAQAMEKQLGLRVDTVPDRRAGLAALRREEYAVVILDENLALADAVATDVLWKQASLAVPIEINFAICGCARITREVRAALQSELAMRETGVTPAIAARLQTIRELANSLRDRLRQPAATQEAAKAALAR